MQLRSHGGLVPALRNRGPRLPGRLPPHRRRNLPWAVAGDGQGGAGSLQVRVCDSHCVISREIKTVNFTPLYVLRVCFGVDTQKVDIAPMMTLLFFMTHF